MLDSISGCILNPAPHKDTHNDPRTNINLLLLINYTNNHNTCVQIFCITDTYIETQFGIACCQLDIFVLLRLKDVNYINILPKCTHSTYGQQ